jgi:hypothetical protein
MSFHCARRSTSISARAWLLLLACLTLLIPSCESGLGDDLEGLACGAKDGPRRQARD